MRKIRLVQGVGINDVDLPTEKIDPVTGKRAADPYYRRWGNMLERCYNETYHVKHQRKRHRHT